MDLRLFTRLVLKLTGVIVIITTLTSIPRTYFSIINHQGSAQSGDLVVTLGIMLLAGLLPMVIGYVLIAFSGPLSDACVPQSHHPESSLPEAPDVPPWLLSGLLAGLGIYFCSTALFDAVYWLARIKIYFLVVASKGLFAEAPAMMPDDFAGIVSTAAQFVLGALLILGHPGLARMIGKLRGR